MRILKRLRSYCSLFVVRIIWICSLCAPVSLVQAQVSGNYTINNTLPTSGRNFNSFFEASLYLSNGLDGPVTIDVAPGTGPYNEQWSLGSTVKSSATKPLIFNCNGVTQTFLSTDGFNRALIKLDSVDYVTIDNLVIVPTAVTAFEYGVGIHLLNDADHNTIRNCKINNNVNTGVPQNNEGIVINGSPDFGSSQGASHCDSNLIINNTITGGNTGITMSSVPNYPDPAVLMKGNRIIDNKISNAYNSGIYLLYNDNTLVQGNDITGGPDAESGNGIICFEPNTNMQIIGNRIHHFVANAANTNSELKGINFGGSDATPTSYNLIANNLIYDFQSAGEQIGIAAQYGGSFLNIYHNTISLEDQTVPGGKFTYGIYTDDYSNINILNNIVTVSRATNGRNVALYMETAITTFTSERNLFYVPSGSTSANAVGYYGGLQTSLAAWQTKTGRDLLSVNADPKYTDPANFVLIPTDSAIDNMGQYININNDITGAVRNNTHPDIGAYEFLTPSCIGPVLGGNTTLLPGTTVCEGSPVALNLTGNSFGTGQSYQWQTAATINGSYTNIGSTLSHPAATATATTTLFYRAAVTCGSLVEYSVPLQLNVTPRLTAGTYTINNAVATGGTNFQSYNDALNAIRCGVRGAVVFNVVSGSGPYREQLIIPDLANTSANNTVTFNGNGTTLVYLSTVSAERAVIKLNGANYFIFDNLNIVQEASTTSGVGVQMLNDADNNIIRNCTITLSKNVNNSGLAGIVISPSATSYTSTSGGSLCDSNTITGNTIIGGHYGITCVSSGNEPSLKNTITNNTIQDFSTYGMWVSGTSKALVEGNDISRPSRSLQMGSSFNGIFVDGQHRNLLVSKNKVHNPFDGVTTNTNAMHGIFVTGSDATMDEPVIISNNLVYNFNGSGDQHGITNSSPDSIQYYHNTISLEDSSSVATRVTKGFNSSSEAHGLILKNNSFVIKRGGTGTKHCIFINNTRTTFTSDYNNLLMASNTGTNNFTGRINSTNHATIEAWRTAAVNDVNSLNVDPVYQNPANVDFTPTLLAMDNKGTPVGITTDIKGATRRAKPDIGAFEFDVCLPLGSGPVLKVDTAALATNTVRFSWTPVTNATGYQVSTDGVNFVTPSSGPMGLTHTITGLTASSVVALTVQALGTQDICAKATSNRVETRTLTNVYFVPNTFTPNGNLKNDKFVVHSNVISTMRMMIFNQWGEKIFETSSQQNGWDGTYKGKQQPVGVYVYVLTMTLNDGTVVNKKGTVNLIR